MNLPSIFNSASNMKGKPQHSTPGPREQPPQDMFGLGIQVFKIDAKKDTMDNSSAGKARRNMKNFENPTKKSSTPSSLGPKQRKGTGSLLPNIYGQQQREIKVANTRTESILSKKKIENSVTSTGKIQSIKEIVASRKPIPPAPQFRNLAQDIGKADKIVKPPPSKQNKTMEKVIPLSQQPEETEKINKTNWRESLNELTKFYTECDEFQKQKQSKIGRKKNQDYLGDHESFVTAYIDRQQCFYPLEDEYQHFGIENYGEKGFSHLNYQNFEAE